MGDSVNHPAHYRLDGLEVIDIIRAAGHLEGFCKGNALKYILRAGSKDGVDGAEDLRKAAWYLNHLAGHLDAMREANLPAEPAPSGSDADKYVFEVAVRLHDGRRCYEDNIGTSSSTMGQLCKSLMSDSFDAAVQDVVGHVLSDAVRGSRHE
jgi:hypothetical protein